MGNKREFHRGGMMAGLLANVFVVVMASGCVRLGDKTVVMNPKCSIDTQSPDAPVSGEVPLEVNGWSYQGDTGRIGSSVFLEFSSEVSGLLYRRQVHRGPQRQDVATALGRPELSNAGFSGLIDFNGMPSDTYTAAVVEESQDRIYRCPTRFAVRVKADRPLKSLEPQN